MKRKISILLVITMLCGMLPAAAMDEAPVLDLNNVIENNNIQFNLEDIPTVVSDNDNAVPLTDNVSLYNDFSVEVPQSIENIPKIEMPEIDTILLPPNKTESDVENVVSTENMTDETDETDTLSEPLILNSSSSIDSAQRISNINSKDSFALQNQTGRTNFIGDNIGEEYIDPMTGNLVVTETDLVLPGVDGLDLNLSRY